MSRKDELQKAKEIAAHQNPRILDTLKEKARNPPTEAALETAFGEILEKCKIRILQAASNTKAAQIVRNFYDLVEAPKLAEANRLSRLVSTHLGAAWEEMAALSHLAMRPEERILGVDIVLLEGERLRHTQIKTQKNTLTGSQVTRSREELELHDFPLFAAAFGVANWTFNAPNIDRVTDGEFWDKKLGISHKLVRKVASQYVGEIEKALFKIV